ncbi:MULTISPECIES: hypothetical protein [Cupriavidus]|uniref:Uncharacterized protein n=1 Tax=Cupriavidus oxalaticus TaxID=96344 RepID=A0A4P7LTF7_9BURK|nr:MULTISPECIES: hypothetical protein [Cupriavidus]MBF6990011.1 hypothetical protein [Cupriavidus sp. IK-TO18]QBY55771.1 hypothetical protein E0W60_32935 [Cupriavidus oxalaticus]TDF67432.1 hypothetical protein E1J61_03945 [Cupriavidus sp. L7L]
MPIEEANATESLSQSTAKAAVSLRTMSQAFWSDFLCRRPLFPAADGMFPFDPLLRSRYIEVQGRTYTAWRARAVAAGFSASDFFDACIRVRAAMY